MWLCMLVDLALGVCVGGARQADPRSYCPASLPETNFTLSKTHSQCEPSKEQQRRVLDSLLLTSVCECVCVCVHARVCACTNMHAHR